MSLSVGPSISPGLGSPIDPSPRPGTCGLCTNWILEIWDWDPTFLASGFCCGDVFGHLQRHLTFSTCLTGNLGTYNNFQCPLTSVGGQRTGSLLTVTVLDTHHEENCRSAMRTWCIKTSSPLGLDAERPESSILCVAVFLLNRQALCSIQCQPLPPHQNCNIII